MDYMDRHLAMEAFVRVIDTGSFSGAARQMQVGQPTVSKAVAQIEDWLGVRLLLRSTRSLTPTEAGQNFYDRARRALEETEEAVLAARGAGAGLTGRISASVCFGRLHIMRQLSRFLEKHPELSGGARRGSRTYRQVPHLRICLLRPSPHHTSAIAFSGKAPRT
jgi:DNA-binding transcriptional LysR family regulator